MGKLYAIAKNSLIFLGIILIFAVTAMESKGRESGFQGIQPQGEPTPLLPFLDYYIDETLSLDIEEAAAPARAQAYKQLSLENLPRVEGITWLRFTISALAPDARPATFLLDMGQSVPGIPILYNPERNELSGAFEWRENSPGQRNILLLPEAAQEPITCYIKLEGLPGPWFSPMIRTPQNAASNWGSLSRTAAILALAVIMAICLLRGISESGQWRIWTAFFVAVALAQAILGMPVISENTSMTSLAAILCPGIALMLLPHVGRHLMSARQYSRSIDIQLLLLSLPGAVIAILPLLPDWKWLDRWVELWPLGTVLFLPTAIGAWIMGLGGSRRFLIGSLFPPLFTGLALVGLEFGFPAYLLASGPLWGVALCALVVATTSARWDYATDTSQPETVLNLEQDSDQNPVIALNNPLDDPNLRLIPPSPAGLDPGGENGKSSAFAGMPELEKLENALRTPVDELLRQGDELGSYSLSPSVRSHAEKMIQAAKKVAQIVTSPSSPLLGQGKLKKNNIVTFNLQRLIREAHDSVAVFAENSGTSLSWHMPPHLVQFYRGNAQALTRVLCMLLESSIRASEHGAVRLTARRVPNSEDEGNILFTVADNGKGTPPENRSTVAMARAWELASSNGGYMGMESSQQGCAITFSMRLLPAIDDEQAEGEENIHVIVACENDEERAELMAILEKEPYRLSEARTQHEALVSQSIDPAPLLITRGNFATPAAADMAREFSAIAHQAGFTKIFVLAITADESQRSLLKQSGFTHRLTEAEVRDRLIYAVRELLAQQSKSQNDDNSTQTGQTHLSGHTAGEEETHSDARYSREAAHTEEKPAPELDKTPATTQTPPTPLVEQDLGVNSGFDTPEWLESDKVAPEPPEVENKPSRKGSYADEWVGEPMPIQKPSAKGMAKTTILEPQPQSSTVADFTEAGKPANGASQKEPTPARTINGQRSNPERTSSESEAVSTDPVIAELVTALDEAIADASWAFEQKNGTLVAKATARISQTADNFGLRLLSRMAQCVERAAKAGDMTALKDLLPELALAVERNRITLTQNK